MLYTTTSTAQSTFFENVYLDLLRANCDQNFKEEKAK